MGISNYYPNSRASQPGVCTSTTRPALPYEGQVIYETDTDKVLVWTGTSWSNAGVPTGGSAGQVLTKATSSDYNTSWADPMGLVHVTTCTTTSVGGTAATASGGVITIGTNNTSVTVSNAFSANYQNYRIIYSGGVSSATDAALQLQLGASTTTYYNLTFYDGFAGGGLFFQRNNAASGLWTWVGSQNTAGDGFICIDVFDPYDSARYTKFTGSVVNAVLAGFVGGVHKTNASYTDFTISPSAGNLTGGKIRVYGYRN